MAYEEPSIFCVDRDSNLLSLTSQLTPSFVFNPSMSYSAQLCSKLVILELTLFNARALFLLQLPEKP